MVSAMKREKEKFKKITVKIDKGIYNKYIHIQELLKFTFDKLKDYNTDSIH